MSLINPTEIVLYLAAGMSLGAIYFLLLFQSVRLLAAQAAMIRIIPLYILRFAAVIAAFWFIAQEGAYPLGLTLLGFLTARLVIQRWIRPA